MRRIARPTLIHQAAGGAVLTILTGLGRSVDGGAHSATRYLRLDTAAGTPAAQVDSLDIATSTFVRGPIQWTNVPIRLWPRGFGST